MYAKHDVFETPNDATEIWHYTTLGRLAGMLALKSLFFVRANQFPDPWEASVPAAHFEPANLRAYWRRLFRSPEGTGRDDADLTDHAFMLARMDDKARANFVLNCWCRSDGESDLHWHTYGRDAEGVAIRSTVGRLKRALKRYKEEVYIGEVKYIDFETELIPDKRKIQRTVYKRLAFRNDQEVRAVIDASKVKGRFTTRGGFVEVEMNELAHEIVLSPMANRSLTDGVKAMLKVLGVGCHARRSKLLDPPKYRGSRFIPGKLKTQTNLPFGKTARTGRG